MSTLFVALIFLGAPCMVWYLEQREASGAAQRAAIRRLADRDRRRAQRPGDKPAFSRRGTCQRIWIRGYWVRFPGPAPSPRRMH